MYRVALVATLAAATGLVEAPAAAFDARVGWDPVQNVAGYRLYIRPNGQPYGPSIDVGLPQPVSGVVQYVAYSLPSGITNFFAVSSYDALGRESGYSNELSLIFGTPVATATPSRTPIGAISQPATKTPTPPAVLPTATRSVARTGPPTLLPNTAGTPVFTSTPTPLTRRRVRFRNARALQGATVTVPVRISAGSGVRFVTLTATFDPAVVAAEAGALSVDAGAGNISVNVSTPGSLSLSAELQRPMTESGELLDVTFAALGACKSRTAIHITSCVLDGGAVGCRTGDGRITVRCR